MRPNPKQQKSGIRLATFEDIPALRRLDSVCGLNSWTIDIYKGLILNDSCEVTVWFKGLEIIGFCAVRTVKPELELLKIGVDPGCQRSGIATELLHEALRAAVALGCRECFLEVRWSNDPAISFYIKEGFEMVGVRRRYYKNPLEDARVMRKRL